MHLSREDGFSMLEVVIALVILAVGLLALSSMQGIFVTGNLSSRELTRATELANAQMENLNAASYADTSLSDANGDGMAGLNQNKTAGDADHADTVTEFKQDYTVSWNVAENSTIDMKLVEVIVTWKGGRKSVQLDWVKPKDL